ncbi:hypothetical protein PHYSODRAFT_329271 [Phytophthora sojae]|uniref:Myb/SANT-like domain-containing protein n=1 Tax=Phytophthora sojae (strain P6497) TaxID=1094619 RepID=G4ZBT1_PHYSP|nr:hypothetical protein PHYSODRAFT_329271 [Phytophthora sojae]EGZ21285.1 hypothetical protein PHYSODRAFT_329271 [Phytophthora sojae]|eukprot:XP_009524002.1 hypothetical protein PHYSODRAFT_329271 [Phytophthora sojae]
MSRPSSPDPDGLKALAEAPSLAECIGYNDIWARPLQVQGLLHSMMMARAGSSATALQYEDAGSQAAGLVATGNVLANSSLSGADNMATSQPTGGASSTPTVSAAGSGADNAVTSGSKAKQKDKRSSSTASKKRTALTADKKPNTALEWTNVMVHDLMSLRYEAHAARFSKAKNNAALKEAWLLLATELSTNQGMAISSEQCKNRVFDRACYDVAPRPPPLQFRLRHLLNLRKRERCLES